MESSPAVSAASEAPTQGVPPGVSSPPPHTTGTQPATMPLRQVRLDVQDLAGLSILHSLAQAGHILLHGQEDEEPAPAPAPLIMCPLCGSPTKELQHHGDLKEDVCFLCWRTTEMVTNRFQVALNRHRNDFHGQLPQMVKDVRAGADEPTFYRGLDG